MRIEKSHPLEEQISVEERENEFRNTLKFVFNLSPFSCDSIPVMRYAQKIFFVDSFIPTGIRLLLHNSDLLIIM